jgi:hypothetical protein
MTGPGVSVPRYGCLMTNPHQTGCQTLAELVHASRRLDTYRIVLGVVCVHLDALSPVPPPDSRTCACAGHGHGHSYPAHPSLPQDSITSRQLSEAATKQPAHLLRSLCCAAPGVQVLLEGVEPYRHAPPTLKSTNPDACQGNTFSVCRRSAPHHRCRLREEEGKRAKAGDETESQQTSVCRSYYACPVCSVSKGETMIRKPSRL